MYSGQLAKLRIFSSLPPLEPRCSTAVTAASGEESGASGGGASRSDSAKEPAAGKPGVSNDPRPG